MRARVVHAAASSGGPEVLDALWGRRLTTLVYHRVISADDESVFEPGVVSATPADFAQQMAWVAKRFDLVSISDLRELLDGSVPWPRRPLLVTFDDGYADNHIHAWPVFRAHSMPAVVFVVTEALGTDLVPWWDRLAQLVRDAPAGRVDLPLIGEWSVSDTSSRERICAGLAAGLKAVPADTAVEILEDLPDRLGVRPVAPREPLLMSWEQASELHRGGVEIHSHTARHPILTCVDDERLTDELELSARTIEQRLGHRSDALAYPNGRRSDVDRRVIQRAASVGYRLAFTMDPGPSRLEEVRAEPLSIRRVSIEAYDDMPRFRLKVMGAGRQLSATPIGNTAARASARARDLAARLARVPGLRSSRS